LAFYGTFFTEGSGKVVVYATGDRTFLGTIATSTMNTETRQSTLNIEIHYFIKIMSIIAIALGITFFIIAVAVVKYPILEVMQFQSLSSSPFVPAVVIIPFSQALIFAIGIIVANVPEGLLPQVCIVV
jgi:sodium/potassium-transporting ATPase subunit alpha